MKLIKIESYPNREIRVTLVRSQTARVKNFFADEIEAKNEIVPSSLTCHSLKTLTPPKERRSSVTQSEGLAPGYGGLPRFQQFSTYGRRQILRAGGALVRHAPHSECLFLTLTLPGSTQAAMEGLARWSSYSVQRLKAWLGHYISNNLSIYTWEWQKRGALHLHYVVHCKDRERGEWIIRNLKQQWMRILDAIGEASGIDLYRKHNGFSWASNKEMVRTDAQWCEKSVAAYLSKYVSKAAKNNHSMAEGCLCPARWYGVSRPLLALLRSMTTVISLDSLRDWEGWGIYEDCLSVLQSWAIKCYEYIHKVGDGKTVVSYVDDVQKESIWNTIMSQIPQLPDSSESTASNLTKLAQQGIYVMKKSPTWLATFKQFCANSRPGHLTSSPLCKDITPADLAFVLDMLIYTFRYTERTRSPLPGNAQLWYTNMLTVLAAEISNEDENLSALAKAYK